MIFTSKLFMTNSQRASRLLVLVCAALLLSACAGTIMNEGRAPPRVDVPEPGGRARTTAPQGGVAGSARAYPQPERPPQAQGSVASSSPAREFPASQDTLPVPGAAPSDDSLTIEPQSTPGLGENAVPDYAPAQSRNSAVNTLLAQADTQRRGGNVDAAIAAAERALRIAPSDPAVYYQLAMLRLEQGDKAAAGQLARKGLSYQPDPELRQRLNDIVARAGMQG